MDFYGVSMWVGSDQKQKWVNFGNDPDHILDTKKSNVNESDFLVDITPKLMIVSSKSYSPMNEKVPGKDVALEV